MRILLVGNYAPDRQQSMVSFASLMHRELPARGYDVTLLQPQPKLLGRRDPRGGLGKCSHIDKFVLFPRVLNALSRLRTRACFDHRTPCPENTKQAHHNPVSCQDVLALKSAVRTQSLSPPAPPLRHSRRQCSSRPHVRRSTLCADSAISRAHAASPVAPPETPDDR